MSLNNEIISNIEGKIGYTFKDKSLLSRAFTHASFDSDNKKNYQTLEFLGDSIVDFIVAERLMEKYPDYAEGSLTKIRASVVSENPLSEAINAVRISEYMLLGIGEQRAKVYEHRSVMSDLFESITGAIYFDGGIDEAKKFVLKMLNSVIENAIEGDDNSDAKSQLNEYAAKHLLSVKYILKSQSGPAHKPMFEFSVALNGAVVGDGKGATKQDAQQNAAKQALLNLK